MRLLTSVVYEWYGAASVCYAYLSDVNVEERAERVFWHFRRSRWFRRGWTLQELLAPVDVQFFDMEWTRLGNRNLVLCNSIETTTGIPADFLTGVRSVQSASIARRMSWAAKRETTRREDIAYCLMGIFDVNMPMLYGEGDKAFLRLQEAIMQSSDDQTLFAWADPNGAAHDQWGLGSGLFAFSPAAFAESGSMVPFEASVATAKSTSRREATAITNRGVYFDCRFREEPFGAGENDVPGTIAAMLECTRENNPGYATITLAPTEESPLHYRRIHSYQLFFSSHMAYDRKIMYVRQGNLRSQRAKAPYHLVRLECHSGLPVLSSEGQRERVAFTEILSAYIDRIGGQDPWNLRSSRKLGLISDSISIPKGESVTAYIILGNSDENFYIVLMIGSNRAWDLVFDVWEPTTTTADAKLFLEVWRLATSTAPLERMPDQLLQRFVPHPASTSFQSQGRKITVHMQSDGQIELVSISFTRAYAASGLPQLVITPAPEDLDRLES